MMKMRMTKTMMKMRMTKTMMRMAMAKRMRMKKVRMTMKSTPKLVLEKMTSERQESSHVVMHRPPYLAPPDPWLIKCTGTGKFKK